MMLRKFLSLFRSDEASGPPPISGKITVVGGPAGMSGSVGTSSGSQRVSTFGPDIDVEEFLNGSKDVYVPPDVVHHNREGLAPLSAAQLIQANRTLVDQALQAFTHKHLIPEFDRLLVQLIRRVAHWMGPFPASRGHHHPNRGGLFTHSIGVAVASLHMSVAKNVTVHSSPRERDADNLAWQLSCFIGGLLHDIGKLNTTGRVYPHSVANKRGADGEFMSSAAPVYAQPWEPMVEGFEAWVEANEVLSYYIDFDWNETLPHRDFVVRYIMALVPRPLLAFIYNSNDLVRTQFEDFIRNPESAALTPIFTVVRDADHMNVAQSIDPRRRPGAAETTALVIRRFHEFASEARWNLPSSPFIYAHVQRQTEHGIRYYGVPFFVASETSIEDFITYLTSRPLMGVSFGQHMREIIFNTLEATYVMNRTVDKLLPEQLASEELQDYVPASQAIVRFRAQDAESIIRPVGGGPEDALLELSVIPLSIRPPASVMLNAPTLSFSGEPASSAAAVVQVTVENGRIAPADHALRRDPEYMREFGEEGPLTEQEEKLLKELPRAVAAKTVPKTVRLSDRLSALTNFDVEQGPIAAISGKDVLTQNGTEQPHKEAPAAASSVSDAAPGAGAPEKPKTPAKPKAKAPVKAKVKADPQVTAEAPAKSANKKKANTPASGTGAADQGERKAPEAAKASEEKEKAPVKQSPGKPGVAPEPAAFHEIEMPVPELDDDAPSWQFAYVALNSLSPEERRNMFWAFVWLYLRDHPAQTVHAILNGKGGFALRGTSIPKSCRDKAVTALKEAGLHIGHLSKHWPSNPLRLDSESFSALFTLSISDDGLTTVDLGGECSAMIEHQLESEPDRS